MVSCSCLCGDVRYEYSGEPTRVGCHCLPCIKTSGTPMSWNYIVPKDNVKVLSGSVKTWSRIGDSGKKVTYTSCATCPSIIRVDAEAMPDAVILKLGGHDNLSDIGGLPGAEIYNRNRLSWFEPVKEAAQFDGPPPA